jgi:membrane-bound ClpP family serine protease
MVLLEGIALGWILILIGAVLLLFEVHSPGFFATVPATVMIFLGILLLLGVNIFNSGWGVVITGRSQPMKVRQPSAGTP